MWLSRPIAIYCRLFSHNRLKPTCRIVFRRTQILYSNNLETSLLNTVGPTALHIYIYGHPTSNDLLLSPPLFTGPDMLTMSNRWQNRSQGLELTQKQNNRLQLNRTVRREWVKECVRQCWNTTCYRLLIRMTESATTSFYVPTVPNLWILYWLTFLR